MAGKKKNSNASRSKQGPQSNSERTKKSRKTVSEDLFERVSTKKILVVLDGKTSDDYPELVLKNSFENKGVEYTANAEHINFFQGKIEKGPTIPLTNRDVIQSYGLCMPGITVIGETAANPAANPPPPSDIESEDEEEPEEAEPEEAEPEEAEPEPEHQRRSKRVASAVMPAPNTRSRKKMKNVFEEAAQAARARNAAVDDSGSGAENDDGEGGGSDNEESSDGTSNPPNSLKVFPPGLEIFNGLHCTVYENLFCDLVGLAAAYKYIPYNDDDDIAGARNELKSMISVSGFPHMLDFKQFMLVPGVTMSSLASKTILEKRCANLDDAFQKLTLNDAYESLQSQAQVPMNPQIQFEYKPTEATKEHSTPLALSGFHVMNIGHYVGFDIEDKLRQFVTDPTQPASFVGKSAEKELKDCKPLEKSSETPSVHFCTYWNLHSAIQSQPEATQMFLSNNFDTIIWFGSGRDLCRGPSHQSPSGTYNENMDRTMRDSLFSWITSKALLQSNLTSYPPMESIVFFQDR